MHASRTNIVDFSSAQRACTACALRTLCIGGESDEHDLERIDRLVEYRAPLAAGQTLFHAGEPMRSIHLVRSGVLKSIAEHSDGSVQVLAFHFPGDLIGMDAFGSGRHTCRVEALERSRVCPLPWERLQRLADEVPTLRKALMMAVGRETLTAHHHLSMMGCPAPRRLALFLADLSARRARLSMDANLLQLPMSREDIANYLGVAEETVCRQFTRLQDVGVLRVQRKTVHILDSERLHHFDAGGRPQRAAKALERA